MGQGKRKDRVQDRPSAGQWLPGSRDREIWQVVGATFALMLRQHATSFLCLVQPGAQGETGYGETQEDEPR